MSTIETSSSKTEPGSLKTKEPPKSIRILRKADFYLPSRATEVVVNGICLATIFLSYLVFGEIYEKIVIPKFLTPRIIIEDTEEELSFDDFKLLEEQEDSDEEQEDSDVE